LGEAQYYKGSAPDAMMANSHSLGLSGSKKEKLKALSSMGLAIDMRIFNWELLIHVAICYNNDIKAERTE